MRILLWHSLMYFLHSLIDCRPRFWCHSVHSTYIHTSISVWVTHNCSEKTQKLLSQLFDATISIGLEALLQKSALLTFDWIEVLIQTHCGKNLDVAWPRRIVWTQLESVTSTEVPQWLPQNFPVLCDDDCWSERLHAVTTPSGCRLIREQKIVWTSGILQQAAGQVGISEQDGGSAVTAATKGPSYYHYLLLPLAPLSSRHICCNLHNGINLQQHRPLTIFKVFSSLFCSENEKGPSGNMSN